MKTVKELGNELLEKRKKQQELLDRAKEAAGGQGHKMSDDELSEFKTRNVELESLQKDYEKALEFEEIAEKNAKEMLRLEEPGNMLPSNEKGLNRNGGQQMTQKSLGELFVETAQYKQFLATGGAGGNVTTNIKDFDPGALTKTLMTTTAGYAPANPRTDIWVPMALPQPTVDDLLPQITTELTSFKYMEQTTVTNAAETRAEGALAAESALAFTERSAVVFSVSHFIPVSDEQMRDVPHVVGILNQFMNYGLRYKKEGKIIAGPGGSDITGILNTSGTQTQAKGSDNAPDAILKACTKVRRSGNAAYGSSSPNLLVLDALVWEGIMLMKTTDGAYLFGGPNGQQLRSLWGLSPTITENITSGIGLVGDTMWIYVANHQGIEIEMGYIADDFQKFRKSFRGSLRFALPVMRPGAFCKITGL